MTEAGSQTRQQNQWRRNLSSLGKGGNRLDVGDDGTTAECELVGLLPIDSTIPTQFSYENALAIQLAVKHLNEGNGSLIPELSGLKETCPITFSVSFVDTQRNRSHAFAIVDEMTRPVIDEGLLVSSIQTNSTSTAQNNALATIKADDDLITQSETNAKGRALPCAFIGAVDSAVSKSTALVTGLRGFPQISAGSTNSALSDKSEYPLFGRTIPDDAFATEVFLRFLHETMGVRHFFVIFESHPFPRSVLKSLRDSIRKLGWAPGLNDDDGNVMYMDERIIESRATSGDQYTEGTLYEAVNALKKSDYRFVLAITIGDDTTNRLMEIAYEEGVAGNTDGTHFWWFSDTFKGLLGNKKYEVDSPLAKAYNNVGSIHQSTENDGRLFEKFTEQSRELKRELYQSHSDQLSNINGTNINEISPEWMFAPELKFLNESEWLNEDSGYFFDIPSFSYDATILLGLSACREVTAARESLGGNLSLHLTGDDLFARIKETNFTGITGNVLLDPETGTRSGDSVEYVIYNWLHSDKSENDTTNTVSFEKIRTHVYKPGGDDDWDNVHPFVFSGGKTSLGERPDLPPLTKDFVITQKFIVAISLSLFFVIILATAGFVTWTCLNWKSRVVRASQPFFLLLLCSGVVTMAAAIIPISMEHYGTNQSDITCTSQIWLTAIGFGIIISTLFAKTYRINKIISSSKKCRRVKISVQDTLYPVVIMYLFNVIVLSFMTVYKPVYYKTKATKYDRFEREIEQYGRCMYDEARPFLLTLTAVNLCMVVLALIQVWRARDLSTEFAESKYIANSLLICFIVAILAIPVTNLTQYNPDVDTFMDAILIAIIAGNTLCFIFIPKIRFHIRSQQNPKAPKKNLFGPSTASTARRSSTRTAAGERILTMKGQHELAQELKALKRELAIVKKKASTLSNENAALKQNLRKLTGDGDKVDNDCDGINSESGDLLKDGTTNAVTSDVTFEFNSTKYSERSEHSDSDSDSEVDDSRKCYSSSALPVKGKKKLSLSRFKLFRSSTAVTRPKPIESPETPPPLFSSHGL